MVFSSMVFLCVFLPAAFCLHLLLPGMRAKNFLLVVASLVFYAYGEPIYVILLVASSAGNYILARLTGECPKIRKLTMTLAVVINLGLLVIFKYSGFLVETFNSVTGAGIPVPQVRMPIGISFFTFQALSYVIDVYRGDASVQKNFGKVLLYISFFPQLIAGPIVKYHDVEAEINNRKQTPEEIGKGIRRFIAGLSKKVLIANTMGLVADNLFGAAATGITGPGAWLGAVSYMLQIYFDFSGYSDMAIGISWMLNLDLPVNFDSPYKAYSVVEFWKRWHISLTGFLTKYIYIPLGGSRKGNLKTYCNTMIVFLCSGIWHGASWMFVLWGALHGVAMVLTKALKRYGEWIPRILKRSVTLLFINFTWIIFRTADLKELREVFRAFLKGGISINPDLFQFFGIAGNRIGEYAILYSILLLFSVIGILVFLLIAPNAKEAAEKMKYKVWHGFVAAGIIALCILHFSGVSSFVYFNF